MHKMKVANSTFLQTFIPLKKLFCITEKFSVSNPNLVLNFVSLDVKGNMRKMEDSLSTGEDFVSKKVIKVKDSGNIKSRSSHPSIVSQYQFQERESYDPYFPLVNSNLPNMFLESPNIHGLNNFYYCAPSCVKRLNDIGHVCRSPSHDFYYPSTDQFSQSCCREKVLDEEEECNGPSESLSSIKVCKGLLGGGDNPKQGSEPGPSSSSTSKKRGRRPKGKGYRGTPVQKNNTPEMLLLLYSPIPLQNNFVPNQGLENTCFANSALQVLFSFPDFVSYIQALPPTQLVNKIKELCCDMCSSSTVHTLDMYANC